jgi:hypothetical protein
MYHDMCVLVTIEEDVPEAEGSLEGTGSFLDTLIQVGILVHQALANFFRHQQASGNIAPGKKAVLALRNNPALGQTLFMVANPPSPNAASFIRNQINRISSQLGRNMIVILAGDAEVDLRTFGHPNQARPWDGSPTLVLLGKASGQMQIMLP